MIVTAYICAAIAVCDTTPTKVYVIDGDTVMINHERIRLAGINAPEVKGKCVNEEYLAALATAKLAEILQRSKLVITRQQKPDRYGRTLATIAADGQNAGEILLREGLARRWTKKWDHREEPWCQGKPNVRSRTDGRRVQIGG